MNQEQLEKQGIELAKEIIVLHDEEVAAYAMYGDILQASGKSQEARQQYIKALEFDQSNFTIWQFNTMFS